MTTTEELGQQLDRLEQPPEQRTVLDLITRLTPELQRSLQDERAAEILARHYYSALRFNPLLMTCTAESQVAALLLTAQVRLEPGPLGHVYLVPFRNAKRGVHEVVWMLGYTGIAELARRGGALGLRATVVWDCDEYVPPWENEKGLHWTLKPGEVTARGERVGVLVAWKENGERLALHCPPSRIDRALEASPSKDKSRREEDWYWRKTAVRFARPWLPLTTELALAARSDDGIVYGVEVEEGSAAALVTASEAEHDSL